MVIATDQDRPPNAFLTWLRHLSKWNILLRIPILVVGIDLAVTGYRELQRHANTLDETLPLAAKLEISRDNLLKARNSPETSPTLQAELTKSIRESEDILETLNRRSSSAMNRLAIGAGYCFAGSLFILHGWVGMFFRKRDVTRLFDRPSIALMCARAISKWSWVLVVIWLKLVWIRIQDKIVLLRLAIRIRSGRGLTNEDIDAIRDEVRRRWDQFRSYVNKNGDAADASLKTLLPQLERASQELGSPEYRQRFQDKAAVFALRGEYLFRRVYINPMLIGAGITLAAVSVADVGLDTKLGSWWTYLLGIGTSLVAWQFVNIYEQVLERTRLKLLARTLLATEDTYEEGVATVKSLAEKVAPDAALHLLRLARQLAKTPNAANADCLKQEINLWA